MNDEGILVQTLTEKQGVAVWIIVLLFFDINDFNKKAYWHKETIFLFISDQINFRYLMKN
jgi:hypothetical protein